MACPHSGRRLQEQPGQMVTPPHQQAPPPPPTQLSAKWRWLGPTRASSWRELKASVGTGSPEEAAERLQGCGWGGRERWLGRKRTVAGEVLRVWVGVQSAGHPGLGSEQPCPPSSPSWPFSGPGPTTLPFSSEHLRGLYPGQDGSRGGPHGKRREGRPGHPRRARPRQLHPGRRRGRGVGGSGWPWLGGELPG